MSEEKSPLGSSAPATGSPTSSDFKDVFAGILARGDAELFGTPKAGLRARYFHFRWDSTASKAWNLYEFTKALELYRSFSRRWEEHHNGSCCVVERVRVEYLMPEIKAFVAMSENNIAERRAQQKGDKE